MGNSMNRTTRRTRQQARPAAIVYPPGSLSIIRPHNKLTADQTAELFTTKLQKFEPFYFIRYGDGALECIYGLAGKGGQTRDLEAYHPGLGRMLLEAWNTLMQGSNVYVGDWLSASFNDQGTGAYLQYYEKLIGNALPHWVHPEALLFMRESQALAEFYRVAAADPRRKVYLGPKQNNPAARLLDALHIEIPMVRDLVPYLEAIQDALTRSDFEVLYYGAGMAGNIAVIRTWTQFPGRTYIHLGSALDILGRGKTRQQQLPLEIVLGMLHKGFTCSC
jgi:hypothetical protein